MWLVLGPMLFVCLFVMAAAGLVTCAEAPRGTRRRRIFLYVESVLTGKRKRQRLAAKRRARFDLTRPVNVYPPANLNARPAAPAPRPRPPMPAPMPVVASQKRTRTRPPRGDIARVPCACGKPVALTVHGKYYTHTSLKDGMTCRQSGKHYVQYLIHEDPV